MNFQCFSFILIDFFFNLALHLHLRSLSLFKRTLYTYNIYIITAVPVESKLFNYMAQMNKMSKNKEHANKTPVCGFCKTDENDEFLYGKFYHLKSVSVHHNCMFFSSGLSQQGKNQTEGILGFLLKDIEAELSRGKRLRCSYCKKTGATVGCSLGKCKKTFHFPCGLKNLSLHQYFGAFCSFCKDHKPKQKEIKVQDEDLHCHICYTCVSHHELGSCLYPPCCKKNFFHRTCLQKYALSAGFYFFKCPLCNNSSDFIKEMQVHGICIPEKDASWELETNAFGELLHRPECGADICHCIHGRKYSGKKYGAWDLVSCSDCGSAARHKYCENFSGSSWLCNECKVFEDEIKKKKQSSANYFPRVICKLVDIKTNTPSSNFKNNESLSETLIKTFQSDIVGEACKLDIVNEVCRPDTIDETYQQDTENKAYQLNTEAEQKDNEGGTFQSLDIVEGATHLVNGSNSLLSSHCDVSYSKAGLNLDPCFHNVAGNSDSYVNGSNLNLTQLSETEDLPNDSCNTKKLARINECLNSKAVSVDTSKSRLRNKTINRLHNESSQVTLKHFVSRKGKKRKLETKLPRKDACCMHHPNKCIKRLLGYECHKYRV